VYHRLTALSQKSGHIDNITPLIIYNKGLTAQEVTNYAVEMVKVSYRKFWSLEGQLNALGQGSNITEEIGAFLQGCIDLAWILYSGRKEINQIPHYHQLQVKYK
jgi:hypothetical protein